MSFLKDLFLYNPENPLIFSNPLFWIFFALVLFIYQFNYQNIAFRNLFLLAVSMFFYYKTGGLLIGLLIFSTLVDYYCAHGIFTASKKNTKKTYLFLSLFLNLGLLAYFKYAVFFTGIINDTFGSNFQTMDYQALFSNYFFGTNWDIMTIILPVGISFYTFQTMGYSIDVYRGEMKPVDNFWDFAFYVSFFPQLVAGPIVRASEFVPQIYQPYRLSPEDYGKAVFLIINGLVKKILIADFIAINFVDKVFEHPDLYTGFANLMAVYGYALQIYCDFSGYTDIAIGLALLLGFRLNINFNSPYKALDITDFWRRWHISLSTWLRDYLYVPLGGNRFGNLITYRNLLITMLLGGLWHGASTRFIIWGGLHGIGLVIYRVWMQKRRVNEEDSTIFQKFFSGLLTFHFVCFCWIFFRAKDLWHVQLVLSQIFTNFQFDAVEVVLINYQEVFFIMFLGYFVHFLPENFKKEMVSFFVHIPDFIKAGIVILIIIGLYQSQTSAIQPFIYFRF